MRDIAFAAGGVFVGMILGGLCCLPTFVRLSEERDDALAATDGEAEL